MKTQLLCIFATGFCLTAFAQDYTDFDLGSYKLPDIVRNQLDLSVNSYGRLSDNVGSSTNKALQGNLKTTFNRYKVTRSFMGQQQVQLLINGDRKKAEEEASHSYQFQLHYGNSSRFYNDHLLFFETGAHASLCQDGFKPDKDTKKHETNIEAALPLRMGVGRIERVEDARQAVYIIENLSKRKVLNRSLTQEELLELAQLISTVKNKRFLDSRLHLIEEIATVDTFFQQKELLATLGSSYFTTLYDYWMYGDRFQRGAGWEFSGGIKPGLHYRRRSWETDSKDVIPSLQADVSFNYEKPANLYWQHSAQAQIIGFYEKGDDMQNNKYNYTDLGLNGGYSIGYYPNSRTNINMSLYAKIGWLKNDESSAIIVKQDWLYTDTRLQVDLYYYFSPQMRLSVSGLVNHHFQDSKKSIYPRWDTQLDLSFTYSFF